MYKLFLFFSTLLLTNIIFSEPLMKPTSLSKDLYDFKILSGNYNENISHPDIFLDFEYGTRVASPAQIENAVINYAKQSDRLKVIEYGKTHEGRSLYAVFISSPSNIDNLDTFKQSLADLSDARKTNDNKARSITVSYTHLTLPTMLWV